MTGPLLDAEFEEEIGRFENELGERFVFFYDKVPCFTGDEVDWERVELAGGGFMFSAREQAQIDEMLEKAGVP